MPPRDPERSRITAVVRWELLKIGLVVLLVVGLGRAVARGSLQGTPRGTV